MSVGGRSAGPLPARVSQSVAPSPLSEALPRQGCSPDAMVCYCFLYRRSDLEREIATVGEAQISAPIATEIKTGNCVPENTFSEYKR